MKDILEEYEFEDIEIHQKKQFKVIITEEMIDKFANISGDFNPLHMDEIYASKTPFKHRVCHGLLLTSFFSRLIGMHLPGKKSLYVSQSLKFISPAFISDEILVEGEIVEKSSSTRLVTIKTTITNMYTKKYIIEGQAKVLVRE